MLKIVLTLVFFAHGLIHLLGFARGFNFGNATQFSQSVSRSAGVIWLCAALLLILSGVLFLWRKDGWYFTAGAGIITSQVMIFRHWPDAKYGTVLNIVLLILTLVVLKHAKSI